MIDNLKLSPPWVTYASALKAMFAHDPDVGIVFDQVNMNIKLYVKSTPKAEALTEILNPEAAFGNVTLSVNVIPGNESGTKYTDAYKTAFEGNNALDNVVTVKSPFGTFTYIVWAATVVQFPNDDMTDYCGNMTVLYQDIAVKVFKQIPGLFHCTENVSGWTGKF